MLRSLALLLILSVPAVAQAPLLPEFTEEFAANLVQMVVDPPAAAPADSAGLMAFALVRATAPGGFSGRVFSNADVLAAPAFYAIDRATEVYDSPEGQRAVVGRVPFRESVRVLEQRGAWSLVQHGDLRGYVPSAYLSNLWIRVAKSERILYLYRGAELVRSFPADVALSDEDKVRRSRLGEEYHYRIPEGVFYVTRLHGTSQYYRAFVINYPNREHALRGLRNGLITEAQYDAISRAESNFQEPPMNTPLGGLIEIHGHGSGRQRAWTRGCVALRNVHMDILWDIVHVGTPVVIEP